MFQNLVFYKSILKSIIYKIKLLLAYELRHKLKKSSEDIGGTPMPGDATSLVQFLVVVAMIVWAILEAH